MKAKRIIAALAVLASPAVLAHAGHSHEAVTSGLIHTVAVISLVGVAYVAYKIVMTKKATKQIVKK